MGEDERRLSWRATRSSSSLLVPSTSTDVLALGGRARRRMSRNPASRVTPRTRTTRASPGQRSIAPSPLGSQVLLDSSKMSHFGRFPTLGWDAIIVVMEVWCVQVTRTISFVRLPTTVTSIGHRSFYGSFRRRKAGVRKAYLEITKEQYVHAGKSRRATFTSRDALTGRRGRDGRRASCWGECDRGGG